MDITKKLQAIRDREANLLIKTANGTIKIAEPTVLSENVTILAIMLSELIEPLTELELQYRETKAAKYTSLIKSGVSRSAAKGETEVDVELARLKVDINRLENYIRRTEQIITTVQSHIKSKGIEARNAY